MILDVLWQWRTWRTMSSYRLNISLKLNKHFYGRYKRHLSSVLLKAGVRHLYFSRLIENTERERERERERENEEREREREWRERERENERDVREHRLRRRIDSHSRGSSSSDRDAKLTPHGHRLVHRSSVSSLSLHADHIHTHIHTT
jgi:hypothetical protein